jgi:hypothetical protein
METPVVYGRSSVNFSDVPSSSDYIEIDNANGVTNKFVFSNAPSTFVISSNTYSVDMRGVRSTVGNVELGLNARQVSINNAARKFITAVNLATGSFITAAPGTRTSEVILTQNIPGVAGNTSNTSSTVKVTISNFTGGNDTYVRYPYGVHVSDGNASMSEVVRRVISTSRSGTLDVPTSGDARLVEGYTDQHGFGAFSPFDESNSHQSFGIAGVRRNSSFYTSKKYGTQTEIDDEFLTRGSVSGSLDESMRVKDKIIIDLTPVEDTTLQYNPTFGQNYPMGYFNFETKKWEKIGIGEDPAATPSLKKELDTFYIGFSQNYSNNITSSADIQGVFNRDNAANTTYDKRIFQESGWASCIDTFGFPLHPKFHATSSQTLDVSTLIDRPFLVEKFIYEFSGSSRDNPGAYVQGNPINGIANLGATFFILNQRVSNPDPGQEASHTNVYIKQDAAGNTFDPPYSGPNSKIFHYNFGEIPQKRSLTYSSDPVYVNTTRDLVTFARIGAIWDTYDADVVDKLETWAPHPAKFMDLSIVVPLLENYDGHFTLTANIKSPTANPSLSTFSLYNTGGPGNQTQAYLAKDTSTRNSLNTSTGRAYGAEFSGPELSYSTIAYAPITGGSSATQVVYGPEKDAINSPYLLMPGDKLVFGWQSSLAYSFNVGGEKFHIGPGSGKLILYGSYLRDDKPVHNIYKDQLNSDAAHEAIPSGPSVLDRFETDPQMMFSGSMREEHITGTMLTRNSDGSLSVTNVNDFTIGGVRAVSARVSDGDVKQRWSFFRNTRLFDSEEQYYDSMQPNPLDVLFPDTSVKAYATNTASYILLMLP